MTCTTCNKPAERGYLNVQAGEACVDPCHGPHLTPGLRSKLFWAFHGTRRARKYTARRAA